MRLTTAVYFLLAILGSLPASTRAASTHAGDADVFEFLQDPEELAEKLPPSLSFRFPVSSEFPFRTWSGSSEPNAIGLADLVLDSGRTWSLRQTGPVPAPPGQELAVGIGPGRLDFVAPMSCELTQTCGNMNPAVSSRPPESDSFSEFGGLLVLVGALLAIVVGLRAGRGSVSYS